MTLDNTVLEKGKPHLVAVPSHAPPASYWLSIFFNYDYVL